MEEKDIREICRENQLQCNKITKAIGSFDKELFFIDDKYLIRTSKQSMLDEQIKINRIKDLKHVPKIVHASDQSSTNCKIYYLILEYIKGSELFANYNDLQDQSIHDIGARISDFLFELHNIKGEKYDIGHYVLIIPGYDKSWRSGHEIYWADIYKGLKNIQLSDDVREVLELSNEYINTNISSLDYENGPSLLHNDFHYKNIIIHNKAFSGVIDWECSQYGEADFDLIHLLHWCLFPPSKNFDMTQLFNTIYLQYRKKCSIPMIEKRLTIYLLEHDFIQILWSNGERAKEYFSRINWWLSGSLEKYIRKLNESM
jgi:aminoglycoside phosphotransferase (APT) family kinase protein